MLFENHESVLGSDIPGFCVCRGSLQVWGTSVFFDATSVSGLCRHSGCMAVAIAKCCNHELYVFTMCTSFQLQVWRSTYS